MRWQLPAGVAALLLLLVLFLPLWQGLAVDLRSDSLPPPPGAPPPPNQHPPNLIPTETDITAVPPLVHKNESFVVVGNVREKATGKPAPNVTVAIFLNLTKTTPGTRVGIGTTDATGEFRIAPDMSGMEARDYQVVALALVTPIDETTGYDASYSDPPIRVVASTHLALLAPARMAYGSPLPVGGLLTDETGDALAGATVTLQAETLPPMTVVTDARGAFATNITFPQQGNYTLHAHYAGTPNRDAATNATLVQIVDVVLLLPEKLDGVRGEPFWVAGAVRLGPAPQVGAHVLLQYHWPVVTEQGLALDHTADVVTNESGFFVDRVHIAPTAPLGSALLQATLVGKSGVAQGVTVEVRARPNLTLVAPAQVGTDVEARVHLQDDLGAPIAGAAVRLEAFQDERAVRTLNLTTDASGNALARLDLGWAMGYVRLQAVYEGGGHHLPAGDARPVKVDGLLWVLVALAVAAAGASVAWWWVARERAKPKPQPSLALEFPQRAALGVWGPGEPVDVAVRLLDADGVPVARAPVTLRMGDEAVELTTGGDGAATVQRSFEREGEVGFVAEADVAGKRVWATAAVRVADYRREVGREWQDLRFHAARLGLAASADLAPREFEAVLRGLPGCEEALEGLFAGFERASYSEAPFGRDDYVAFAMHKRKVLAALRALAPPRAPFRDAQAKLRALLDQLKRPLRVGGDADGP